MLSINEKSVKIIRVDDLQTFLETEYKFENVDLSSDLLLNDGEAYFIEGVEAKTNVTFQVWVVKRGVEFESGIGPAAEDLKKILDGLCFDGKIQPGDYIIKVW